MSSAKADRACGCLAKAAKLCARCAVSGRDAEKLASETASSRTPCLEPSVLRVGDDQTFRCFCFSYIATNAQLTLVRALVLAEKEEAASQPNHTASVAMSGLESAIRSNATDP